jgi:hypothetical protein
MHEYFNYKDALADLTLQELLIKLFKQTAKAINDGFSDQILQLLKCWNTLETILEKKYKFKEFE